MIDLSGKSLKGYQIRERIGAGGFGAVYRAHQPVVNREVAIKVILPEHANRPEFIRGFEAEAQVVARLEHPYIVPLIDFWREPDGAYLVIRYLRGGSLSQLLKNGPLELDATTRMLDHITEALAFAHRHNVVHRDLKPDNILLDDDGNAYLTDFGIAVQVGRGATDDSITGSLQYMSPEQLSNEPATPSVDIYSLGIVLYEMLTGEYPFGKAASITELIHKHLNDPIPDLPDHLPSGINAVIQKATDKDATARFDDARQMAVLFRKAVTGEIATPVETLVLKEVKITNPYKGLRAFQQADAPDFFGRQALTQRLLDRLEETGEASRFLAVVGPSGSGKSSVARAGMIPALQKGGVNGSANWFMADMIPGPRPLDELEVALTRIAANPGINIMEQLQRDEHGLHRVAGMLLPDDGELLLMIDQFEEVFTVVDDEQRRKHFLALLGEAVSHPRSRVRMVITLRADFYDRPLMYPAFGELVRTRMETVMPLTPEDLEQAICRPAEQVGMTVEPGLIAAMVAEVSEQPGSLPLLQYSLTELFDRRENNTLTLATYNQIGGVLGALTRRADEIYTNLSATEQDVLRQLFMRLVTLGEGTEDLRRRVQVSELVSMGVDSRVLDELLAGFANYRLLTMDHDPVTREATVEVAHEALIREWGKLREWLDESRDDIRLQRMLANSAKNWRNANQDESYLLTGARLAQFEAWAQTTDVALTDDERQFLEISITEEQRRQARQRLIRNIAIASISLVAIIFAMLALFAFDREQKAQDARAVAEREAAVNHSLVLANSAQQTYTAGHTDLALLVGLEAVTIDEPPADAVQALREVARGPGTRALLQGHSNGVKTVAFSADSTLALSGSCTELSPDEVCTEGELILWDIETATELRRLEGHSDWVNSVTFSTDANASPVTALSASSDGQVIFWNVETGEIIRRYDHHTSGVNAVTFSPDGQLALSGAADGTVSLWEVVSGDIRHLWEADDSDTAVVEGHSGGVNCVTFSPDGQRALSGSDDTTVIAWDVATGEIVSHFEEHAQKVLAVVVHPDGERVLSSGWPYWLREWDLETGVQLHLQDVENPLTGMAITPDGHTIFYSTLDRGRNRPSLHLMDIDVWRRVQAFEDHPDSVLVQAVAISPDGRLALSGTDDASIRLWNLETDHRYFDTGDVLPWSLDISPDGQYLITGSLYTGAILWDVEQGREVRRFGSDLSTFTGGDNFSPDGRYVISSFLDYENYDPDGAHLVMWEVETGQEVRRFEGFDCWPTYARFILDGRQVISYHRAGLPERCSSMGGPIIWDVETGEIIRRVKAPGISWGYFTRDGSHFVTPPTHGADEIILWDVETWTELRRFGGFRRAENRLQYGSAADLGHDTILALTIDNTIGLLNIETGAFERRFEADHIPECWAISPDGRYLLTGGPEGQVTLWDFETGAIVRRFRGHLQKSCTRFHPDGQTAYSSSFDGTIVEWQIAELPLDELLVWIDDNRYLRELTCAEREQYRVEPLCAEDGE
jgi:WD40 repeat protein/serine/threonine protein kinase